MKILLLAIRSLSRFRLYTAINIIGLAMSLACVIILCRYIHREITTDHFIKDLDRVYYTVLDRNPLLPAGQTNLYPTYKLMLQ